MKSSTQLAKARLKHPPQWLVRTGISLACSLAVGSALAQAAAPADKPAADSTAAPTNALPTVTVTARKRIEKVLDVPVSIQAFSEKDLRSGGISEVKDLTAQAGFNFSSAQGSGAQGRAFGVTTFRGLQGELNFPWENSGGVFIDGIFVSGGVASIGMSDVARVEVLKGPQNAFFGRSTFGGAVNFITKNPANTLSGSVNASLNNHGSTDVDAAIEGPLISNLLSGRVSFGARNKVASFRASDGGDLGAENTKFVTGTLYFTPTDNLWMRLRGHFQQDNDSMPATAFIAAAGNTSCTGATFTGQGRDGLPVQYTPGTAYFCGSIPTFSSVGAGVMDANTAIPAVTRNGLVYNTLNDPFLAKVPLLDHTGMRRDIKRVSAQIGYSMPNDMEAAFNVGYNEAGSNSLYDLDRTKSPNFINVQTNPTKDLTVDARLSSNPKAALRGVIGVSYFTSTFQLSQLDYNPAFGATAPARNLAAYLDLKSTVPAIYGSVEYDITKQITASLEARRQTDKVEFTSSAGVQSLNQASNLLPRLSLRFKPNADTSAYISLAEGVQPLTVNSGMANANANAKAYLLSLYPSLASFTPQPKLKSVELGLKQRVNQSLQFAAAVYDQKWENRLSGTSIFNPAACGTTIFNTPECPLTASGAGVTVGNQAHLRGLELSVDAQLASAWSASAYVDVKKATWDRFNGAGQSIYGSNRAAALTGTAVSFAGNTLGRVPALTIAANTTYRFGLSNGWNSFVRADLTHVGKQWESDYNFAQTDAYSRLDARLGFEKGNVSFELFVKNVANDQSWVSVARNVNLGLSPLVSYSQMGVIATLQEARSAGARLRYTF